MDHVQKVNYCTEPSSQTLRSYVRIHFCVFCTDIKMCLCLVYLKLFSIIQTIQQRYTSRAQRTVCDDTCCCAVHVCTGWPGRHVAGEGRAAAVVAVAVSAFSEWERQMICLLRYGGGVQVRHSQFAHLHSALHACRNLVHICYTALSGKASTEWIGNHVEDSGRGLN
jgi:hypothetical protein